MNQPSSLLGKLDLPGWIDLQVNGHGGVSFCSEELTPDQVAEATQKLSDQGTAGCLPTVITAPPHVMEHSLKVLGEACGDAQLSKSLLGIHLEGPFFSKEPGAKGAHPAECMENPTLDRFQHFQEIAGGHIKLLTLAPELPGAIELIETISDEVVCSAGHTLAGYETLRRAADVGLRLGTHIGNGVPREVNRHDNPIIGQLGIQEIIPSLITDGFHLPEGFIRAVVRTKGTAGCFVVSDQTHLAGMPPGEYFLGATPVVLEDNGFLRMRDEPYLAGSSRTMNQCMEYLNSLGFLGEADLARLGYANPQEILGLESI